MVRERDIQVTIRKRYTRPKLGQGIMGICPSTSVRGQKTEHFGKDGLKGIPIFFVLFGVLFLNSHNKDFHYGCGQIMPELPSSQCEKGTCVSDSFYCNQG